MNTITKQTCSSAEVVSSLSDSQQVTSPSGRALYPVRVCRMGFGGTPIHPIAYCHMHCSTQETSSVGVQPQTCFPSSLLCGWLCCPFPPGHQGRNMEEGSLSPPLLFDLPDQLLSQVRDLRYHPLLSTPVITSLVTLGFSLALTV